MKYTIALAAAQQLICGEGPVWNGKNEKLYWTESVGEDLFCLDQASNEVSPFYIGITVASMAPHKNGGLVLTGKKGFSVLTPEKTVTTFDHIADGIPVGQLNDIIADPLGGVFSGQEAFVEDKTYDTGYLFRIDVSGQASIVADDVHLSNGMGFSPDCSSFYFIDSLPRRIYRFDYNKTNGSISNKKILVQFDHDQGLPDGMTVDSEGFLWVAMFFGGRILRIDPDGKLEREIVLPCQQPTSLTFGGKHLNELFITSAGLEWKTPYAPAGYDYEKTRGGSLYKVTTDFQGKAEFLAAI